MADTTQQATAQQETLAEAMRIVRGETMMLATKKHLMALANVNEDLLEALKMAQKMVAQFIEDYESRKPHPSIAYSDAKNFDDAANTAIARAEGR